MVRSAVVALVLLASQSAFASNFPYTYIHVGFGKVSLDEELVFFDEVYEEFGYFGISGAVQVADNVSVGLALSAMANEGRNTELSQSMSLLFVDFPFAVSPVLDIVPSVGLLNVEVEACLDRLCVKDDDSGMAYGVALRAWAAPDVFEINAGFSDTTLDDSESAVSLGGALWFLDHHRVGLVLSRSSEQSGFTLGYSFNWR